MRRIVLALAMFAPAMFVLAAPVARAQPAEISTTQPAISDRDVTRQLVDFEQRVVVDAYQAIGHHDAAWDGDAHAFLPAQAHDGVEGTRSLLDDALPRLSAYDRAWFARRIARSGCDDAVVLYEAGVALAAARDHYSAAELFVRASEAAVGSKYAPIVQLRIASAMLASVADEGAPPPPVPARVRALLRAALVDRATLPGDRRAVWAAGAAVFEETDPRRMAAIGDAIELTADADPWLYHTLMGRAEVARALLARGGGGDNDAGAEPLGDQKDRFDVHLAAARDHLRQAIAADDVEPQPFVEMIVVASLDDSGTARGWFDFAVARQLDYWPAFAAYVGAIRRAHGTLEQMLAPADEAVAQGRFDTLAPERLLQTVDAIEATLPTRAFDEQQLAEVYPSVARCLDGYVAHGESPRLRLRAHMFAAAWAARLGKWEAAQAHFAALREMDERPDAAIFARYHVDLADAQRRAAVTIAPQP